MAFSFGDSFDLYAAPADMINGYWDSGALNNFAFVAGRFSGSRAVDVASVSGGSNLVKSSGVNDAVHHLVVSFRQQTAAISGATLGFYLELFDGATAQCSVVFRSDGAIVLTSGSPAGTVLATYTGAFTVTGTWYAFEIEVVINNTTGSFAVRKNGNNVNDFSASSLDTQNSANAYANKLQIGLNAAINSHDFDDLFWQSGAATGAWLGDIRCYARMPASDASVTFSRAPTSVIVTPFVVSTTAAVTAGQARYVPFTATYDGTVGTATVSLGTGYTGNMKCSMFAYVNSGQPGAVLGSATTITNPVTGVNTFTFGTPVPVAKGTLYFIGFDSDTSSGTYSVSTGFQGVATTTPYASFPVATPASGATGPPAIATLTNTPGGNYATVNEPQQDSLTSYVYDSTPGDADFYGVASIASTPASVIATTVRAYAQKSDAGTRTMAVQLKSGATTVASPTLVLTTSGWLWAWRTDIVDPGTGAAWTPAAVNNCTIGPRVVA